MKRMIDANALSIVKFTALVNEYAKGWNDAIDAIMENQPTEKPEQHWIPCSERLPEDDTEVIVSCTDDSGDSEFSYTTTGWHFKGMWVVGNERTYFVRAWMPLPKPYEVNHE